MKVKHIIFIALIALIFIIAIAIFPRMKNTAESKSDTENRQDSSKGSGLSAQVNFGPDAPKEFDYIIEGLVSLGEPFAAPGSTNLQIIINSVTISGNVYSEGWQLEDFDEWARVIPNAENLYDQPYLRDCIASDTGELAEGLSLITADVSVTNKNTEDVTYGPDVNIFGNNVLMLVNARGTDESVVTMPGYGSVACSCEAPVAGQYTWVRIEPGETVRYRLAFVSDGFITVENGFLASDPWPKEGKHYLSLILAEHK